MQFCEHTSHTEGIAIKNLVFGLGNDVCFKSLVWPKV